MAWKHEFPKMQARDYISTVWMRLGQYDSERASLFKRGQIESFSNTDNPIISKSVYTRSHKLDLLLFTLCHLTGVAIVLDSNDKQYSNIIGRDLNIEMTEYLIKGVLSSMLKDEREDLERQAIALCLRPNIRGPRAERARQDRLGLSRVQHRVAELYPGLREWRRSQPGEPEVILRPHHGGQRLGGVIWRAETYAAPEGLRFLGLRK